MSQPLDEPPAREIYAILFCIGMVMTIAAYVLFTVKPPYGPLEEQEKAKPPRQEQKQATWKIGYARLDEQEAAYQRLVLVPPHAG